MKRTHNDEAHNRDASKTPERADDIGSLPPTEKSLAFLDGAPIPALARLERERQERDERERQARLRDAERLAASRSTAGAD